MQSPSFVVREIDGEFLVLDRSRNLIHQLNATASLIWRELRNGSSPAAVQDELLNAFEVDAGMAMRDIDRMVQLLESLGLLPQPMSPAEDS
jgi:hypothetical protein